jgi:hypothetical protein
VTLLVRDTPEIVHQVKLLLAKSGIATFCYEFTSHSFPIYTLIGQQILDHLPDLINTSLKLPGHFDQVKFETGYYNQVKLLELNAVSEVYHELLKGFTSMFPKIKYLKLNYFSGVWVEDTNEYQIQLQSLTPERLSLDVSPILKKLSKTCGRMKNNYFFLIIETFENNHHRLFKVSLDYLSIIEVGDVKTEEFEHISRVRILFNSFQFINVPCV